MSGGARAPTGVLLVAALLGCDRREARPWSSDAAAPAPAPAATASATPAASPSPAATRLEILRLTLTSEVKDKEPVDRLVAAGPGQRVWAHVTARNRTPDTRGIKLSFRVAGKVRSEVDLDVERSWSFRTWGYNTMKATDTSGELEVVVLAEDESVLAETTLPIRPRSATRPR